MFSSHHDDLESQGPFCTFTYYFRSLMAVQAIVFTSFLSPFTVPSPSFLSSE